MKASTAQSPGRQMTPVIAKIIALGLILGIVSQAVRAQALSSHIEQLVEQEPSIEQITTSTVDDQMRTQRPPYLFDVRTEEEFDVSHLENAIRLNPGTDALVFLNDYGELFEKGVVVFYCSTGRRSIILAKAVAKALVAEDKRNKVKSIPAPLNLEGGIFRWHNESRPLVDEQGKTDYIHPYSWYAKRLLDRKDDAKYSPR